MGIDGSNPWCNVTKKLIDKYKCPEHLVPVPPKNPRRYTTTLINKKTHGNLLGVAQCHAYQHAKTLVLHSRRLGAFPKDPVQYHTNGGKLQAQRGLLGYPGKDSSHLQRAYSDVIQNFPVIAHKIKVTG